MYLGSPWKRTAIIIICKLWLWASGLAPFMSEQMAWICCSLGVRLWQAAWTPLLSMVGGLDTIRAKLWVFAGGLDFVGTPRRQLGRLWSLIVLQFTMSHHSDVAYADALFLRLCLYISTHMIYHSCLSFLIDTSCLLYIAYSAT